MPNTANNALVSKLDSKIDNLTASIEAHREGTRAFQSEVMNILKGSFEGGKWEPGMAPLLKDQAGRIERLEEKEKKTEEHRMTWKHGMGFSFIGAAIATGGNALVSMLHK